MYPRGRSRDISPVALARQASEERRRSSISMTHYPLPSDPEKDTLSRFYLSPLSLSPSPATTPLTLTPPDPVPLRAHPRARVVRSDNSHAPIDPHDSLFSAQVVSPQPLTCPARSQVSLSLPSSPLIEKSATQVEAVKRARDQARAKRRYETLARAEQVFVTTLERSRRERGAALRLRAREGDELKERERVKHELSKLEQERDCRRSANYTPPIHRSSFRVLARAPPLSPPTPQQSQVVYTFPVPSASSTNSSPMRQRQGSMKARLAHATLAGPSASNPRSVSFDDIRSCMGTVLFPVAHGESVSGKTRREFELLGTLLEAVRWEEGERWQRKDRVDSWTSQVPETVPECEACASASLSHDTFSAPSSQTTLLSSDPSTTSILITSRPISWLSFSSRKSTFSVTTAQTSPPSTTDGIPPISDLPTPQHSCGCATGQTFVAVDVNDSPLGLGAEASPAPEPATASVNTLQGPPHRCTRKRTLSTWTWRTMQSSVSSVLSAAARLQQAYVTATIATLTPTDYTQSEASSSRSRSSSGSPSDYAGRPPSGWRVERSDIAKFTSTTSHAEGNVLPYLVFDLVELESVRRSPSSTPELPRYVPARDSMSSESPTSQSMTISPSYYNADRHIFNANPVHLLSRAQINSWRFRGAPGEMPVQVFCRPELYYRLESGSGTAQEARGGSALKWGWRVVWDTDDSMAC
ncbi:hypothetical protein BGW80DRAFT_1453566 [Lactifluus volemus]|nr:hypothetical protein BGW80DRAFT_1453566 [Lactifluus volemus]